MIVSNPSTKSDLVKFIQSMRRPKMTYIDVLSKDDRSKVMKEFFMEVDKFEPKYMDSAQITPFEMAKESNGHALACGIEFTQNFKRFVLLKGEIYEELLRAAPRAHAGGGAVAVVARAATRTVAAKKKRTTKKRKAKKSKAGAASTPLQLVASLNKVLPGAIRKNMNEPALVNRSGRFADSVEVTDVITTKKGFPSIGYTYDRDNYGQYEITSGSRFADAQRDPRKLIDGSIREIAAKAAIGRFFTRRN